jgi:NADPH:quinone reductase-like Zn-dependent oxidoreductase
MKAFISDKYGPPEMLRMAEVEKPVPVTDEALVKVLAVSVNPADWRSMRAKPLLRPASFIFQDRRSTPPLGTYPVMSERGLRS